MKTLEGQGKKCAMFFTYGGFGVHPTHYSTRQILENQNFVVVSSAEKGKCIACLACVANCPEDALRINDLSGSWSFKMEMEKTNLESMKGQKSKIYL